MHTKASVRLEIIWSATPQLSRRIICRGPRQSPARDFLGVAPPLLPATSAGPLPPEATSARASWWKRGEPGLPRYVGPHRRRRLVSLTIPDLPRRQSIATTSATCAPTAGIARWPSASTFPGSDTFCGKRPPKSALAHCVSSRPAVIGPSPSAERNGNGLNGATITTHGRPHLRPPDPETSPPPDSETIGRGVHITPVIEDPHPPI